MHIESGHIEWCHGGKYIYGEYSGAFGGKALLGSDDVKSSRRKPPAFGSSWRKVPGASGYVSIPLVPQVKNGAKVATTG